MVEKALGKKKPLVDREILLFAGLLLLLPFVLPFKSLAAEILIYGLGAVSFNILLGYTGLLSFGQAAFFGGGAYVTGILLIQWGWHPGIVLALSGLIGAVFAAIIGFLSIQQVGIYFVMLTLAFNQLAFFLAYQWKSVTGGDDGLMNVPRPDFSLLPGLKLSIQSNLQFYLFVWAIFLISFALIRRILHSPFGRVLLSIRDNPGRARAVGYNITLYKLAAFVISGFFTGVAGGLFALFMKMVPITAIELLTSTDFIIMTLLGGTGSLYGPVIGALVTKIASEVLSDLWARWLFILGVIFVVFVLFMRGGIWGLGVATWTKWKGSRKGVPS
ncbi:MAG: branched-chain amino acid ABC transporter permease [Planctomycetaceae bacterium]